METVFYCAVAVGGATVIGTVIGFLFRREGERYAWAILSASAGIMLAAAAESLISPSFAGGDALGLFGAALGMFFGAGTLWLLERIMPISEINPKGRSALLFAIAMAIHNLPEGLAAGLGFATGNTEDAVMIALGIALHNIPEGMIAVIPLVSSGVSPGRALLLSMSGGFAEVLGTIAGYLAIEIAEPILPFTLAFAGGTMLYAVLCEMVPEGQTGGRRRSAFLMIFGYVIMMLAKEIVGN